MKPTGIVKDPIYLKHDMGAYHPENPKRLEVIYQMIEQLDSGQNLVEICAREANEAEISLGHDLSYIRNIASTSGKPRTYLDPDTSTSSDSWKAAAMAVGGLLSLIDSVVKGDLRNGFALVRPPGHHAENCRAMGFCLFNNIALAARHALRLEGINKVAVVDWDLHHGNGTQNCFYEDPNVLFISTHQYPHYPGTGSLMEVGSGDGEGYTVNIPLPAGAGDQEYMVVFLDLILPVLEAFGPDIILVSAGFDAHLSDPLGAMRVTEAGYVDMIRTLMKIASKVCSDRVILTLEGGYDLSALRDSVRLILMELASYDPEKLPLPVRPSDKDLEPVFTARIPDILEVHRRRWPTIPNIKA